ncbi:unnamed protein product [Anisakis simplex]|uniref:Uncharacterized protein n=1 Tax=Anisakis simplex TaxID=6269 RepID=A0A3P6RE12_ANISI|nr:unnamed protein product [Anisakis simplex]
MVPCVRCLTVEANSLAVIPAACETETLQKKRQRNRISSSSPTSNR